MSTLLERPTAFQRYNIFDLTSDLASASAHTLSGASDSVADFLTALEGVQNEHDMAAMLPQAMQIVSDALHHFTTQPDYPIIRDYSLIRLVPGICDISQTVRHYPDLALAQPFASYIAAIAAWSRGSPFSGLAAALAALTVPAAHADAAAWEQFEQEVRRITAEHIDTVIGWELSVEQMERLEAYLRTTHLLLECLDLAYTSQRTALRGSLLLPPGQW